MAEEGISRVEVDVIYVLRNNDGDLFTKSELTRNTFVGYLTVDAARRARAHANKVGYNPPFEIVPIQVSSLRFTQEI